MDLDVAEPQTGIEHAQANLRQAADLEADGDTLLVGRGIEGSAAQENAVAGFVTDPGLRSWNRRWCSLHNGDAVLGATWRR